MIIVGIKTSVFGSEFLEMYSCLNAEWSQTEGSSEFLVGPILLQLHSLPHFRQCLPGFSFHSLFSIFSKIGTHMIIQPTICRYTFKLPQSHAFLIVTIIDRITEIAE